MDKLGDLSDEDLLARLRGHVGKGNAWCAELIAYLVEVDERRLDRVHACSSMWDFCTRKLGMSEGEAHRWIAAARAVRRFPQVLGFIERGELHLCALYALRRYLTNDNVDELLREASGKSTREVEAMVATRFPRPDVPATIEPAAPQASLRLASPLSVATPSTAAVVARPSDARPAWSLSPASSPAPAPWSRLEPLSATRYRVELTMSATTKEQIDHIKDLMRHRNPTGDLETILDASLALLLAKLEKERLGKTTRPRRRRPAEADVAITTRAPTAPVRQERSANAPAAPVPSEGRTLDGTQAHTDADTANGEPSVAANAIAGAAEPAAPTPPFRASRPGSRYVPAEVRREVFARDGEQCLTILHISACGLRGEMIEGMR